MHLLTVIRQADNFNHAQAPFEVLTVGLITNGSGDDGTGSMRGGGEGWGGMGIFKLGAISSIFEVELLPVC
jgi:hypothetical protein